MNLRTLPSLTNTVHSGALGLALAATLALGVIPGCKSGNDTAPAMGAASTSSHGAALDPKALDAQLDRAYVIGPTAATAMNYRIAWQYPAPYGGAQVKGLGQRGDSVYLLDRDNMLTRINIASGHKYWRVPVADPVVNMISLNVVDDRAYLTSGSDIYVFDIVNGTQVALWPLEKIANTMPAEFGSMLVYGASNGQVVWISRANGLPMRAYAIGPSINVSPVVSGNVIAAVDVSGNVFVLEGNQASKFWDKHLLGPVVSKPVIANEMLYVAGTDQYIWGYDLRTGRTQWSVFTSAQLTNSPTVIGDRLYQQIPGYGLACYNATPIDMPSGEMFWKNDRVTGNVILQRRGELFAWDAGARKLSLLDATRGMTREDLTLSQADFLIVGGEKNEDIFAASKDGRVVRLVPRN